MLFNSYQFLFAFLPLVLGVFWWLRSKDKWQEALLFLTLASFVFYGWWKPAYIPLIALSILGNYGLGLIIQSRQAWAQPAMIIGIAANLLILVFYKYAAFLAHSLGWGVELSQELPLAISFFTFTQITFLVDCWQQKTQERSLARYSLFVTFFPHLIAGPIVHHRELMHQCDQPQNPPDRLPYLAWGIAVFTVGLAKKLLLADSLAPYANSAFAAAEAGQPLGLIGGWAAALSYSLQLYFDFSGYSDMAIGLALMFGIHLPVNFNAPYQAVSISDFWRRWHITLSRFFREYVYIPLGGNRQGAIGQAGALIVTMLLGGVWHGAGWGFMLWGLYHGILCVLCHGWQRSGRRLWKPLAQGLTFALVVFGWVLFRAESLRGAGHLWGAMVGLQGVLLPQGWQLELGFLAQWHIAFVERIVLNQAQLLWICAGIGITWCFPSVAHWFRLPLQPPLAALPQEHIWQADTKTMIVLGAVCAIACLAMSQVTAFLYFTF